MAGLGAALAIVLGIGIPAFPKVVYTGKSLFLFAPVRPADIRDPLTRARRRRALCCLGLRWCLPFTLETITAQSLMKILCRAVLDDVRVSSRIMEKLAVLAAMAIVLPRRRASCPEKLTALAS